MKTKLILFLLISFVSLFAQELPTDFSLDFNLRKSLDKTPLSNTIEKILTDGNTVWLGTSKGLSKSTDNGLTWTNYYKTKAFGEESVSAVGIHNGIVWASTWHPESFNGSVIAVGTGLRYSTDGDTSWVTIDQPLDEQSDSTIIYGNNRIYALPVTVPEQNFIRDIGFTSNAVWIVTNSGGLRKSTDMGKTWQRVLLPPDNLNSIKPTDNLSFELRPQAGNKGNLNHIGFSICVIDDDTIYVGTAGGINKTTDGGTSWVKFNHTNQSKPISGNHILTIRQNKQDGTIWAATWKALGAEEFWGVSFTSDGGASWETTLADSRTLGFSFKYNGSPGAYTSSEVFAATDNGLFRTPNSGLTWISAPEIIDSGTKIPVDTRDFRCVHANRRQDNSTDIWIGSVNGLIKLNEQNSAWQGDWKVYVAAGADSTAGGETFAFPNPFSPDDENVRIKYSAGKSADVTIRIFDFGMNLVRTLIQNAPRIASDELFEIWDGRDEMRRIVPNGVYFYRIDIGDDKPLFGKIMVMM